MKHLKIIISVVDEDSEEVVAKKTANTFEGAEENLGKLQRFIEAGNELNN